MAQPPDRSVRSPLTASDQSPHVASGRGVRGGWFRWVASAIALLLLLWLLPTDQLLTAFARVPAWVLIASVPIFLSLHGLGVTKWRMMVNAGGGGLGLGDAVRCYYYGLFGNTFLPSLVGGDIVRVGSALALTDSKEGLLLGSLVDRTLDVVAMSVVAGLGIAMLPRSLGASGVGTLAIVVAILVVGGISAWALSRVVPVARLPYRIRRLLARFRISFRAMARRPSRALTALALGITLQISLVSMNAFLGFVCGIEVSLGVWLFAWPMAKLSALLPLTQGGIGVREAALAALLSPFGVAPALAVAAGLLFQAVIITGGLAGGAIALGLNRMGPRMLRSFGR